MKILKITALIVVVTISLISCTKKNLSSATVVKEGGKTYIVDRFSRLSVSEYINFPQTQINIEPILIQGNYFSFIMASTFVQVSSGSNISIFSATLLVSPPIFFS